MSFVPLIRALAVGAATHVGLVRQANEDTYLCDEERGIFAVFDGMGGANAGNVASAIARDTVLRYLTSHPQQAPKERVVAALQAASAAVFDAAHADPSLRGMGTTGVVCLVVNPEYAIIGHVGDSRAYLFRDGHMTQLTRDHTVVEEMIARGIISADEAEHHVYKHVLSRNLGVRAETVVDATTLALRPQDRIMICSDGLHGYASYEAIGVLVGSGDAPAQAATDLVDLAMRGGGGDNTTVLVVETAGEIPSTTQVLRTNGAVAWWQRRQHFTNELVARGILNVELNKHAARDEVLALFGTAFAQAVFYDLEKSTSVNIWTFAQNLAQSSLRNGGAWKHLREVMEILKQGATAVAAELALGDGHLAFLLDCAVTREFVVAELAMSSILAEQLRKLDEELFAAMDSMPTGGHGFHTQFVEQTTVPMGRSPMPTSSAFAPDVASDFHAVFAAALQRVEPHSDIAAALTMAAQIVQDPNGTSVPLVAAREFFGVRSLDAPGITGLYEALAHAQREATAALQGLGKPAAHVAILAAAISRAIGFLANSTARLVVEAAEPATERLREAHRLTAQLRTQVERSEQRRAELERRYTERQASPNKGPVL